ncbi:MAG: extracellular solute-binding protein [Anaerolineae bacterium]|nr:extracellular solute-binding protein [Anaerolineae bacterium]
MFRYITILVAILILLIGVGIAGAQDNIVLTVAIQQWFQDAYNKDYFQAFRDAHPGVDVVVVPDTNNVAYAPLPAYDTLENHLDGVAKYVSMADVLYISPWTITPESTRAGFWLNVGPLVAADSSLDETNFYPSAWRAFRWDNGMWGLPITVTPTILMYDPEMFDAAGLSYPSANWTVDDYANALRTLTKYDDQGNPTQIGCWCDTGLLLYGFLGHSVADLNGSPMLNDPQLAALLETWAPVIKETTPNGGYSSENVPLQIMEPWALSPDLPAAYKTLIPGTLPGGIYGARVEGFGISAGTVYPELAFELVKYLVETPVNVTGGIGTFPALRNSEMADRPNFSVASLDALPPDQQQFLRDAVENGVSSTDMMYFDYVSQAVWRVGQEDADPAVVLQEIQQTILANREAAANWTGAQAVSVATPVPTPSFGSDEIALNFGISLWNLPNQADWERLAREFAASDPQVGVVNLNMQASSDYETWVSSNDCFFLNYNSVNPYSATEYLALDPMLNADPNFNPDDFVPGTLQTLQLNGQTFGYPLTAEIGVIVYNRDTFEQAGIPLPDRDWTIDQFVDTLQQLDQTDIGGSKPFTPSSGQDTDWLLMFAAYGGLPFDFRTNPITWNFTAQETVDAIRQVLDLAKAGLIDYQKLGTFNFGGGGGFGAALQSVTLSGWSDMSGMGSLVNYPRGSRYRVMSLGNVGGGYISVNALNPDACYRWISFIAGRPELAPYMMPARLSALNDPALVTAQGESVVALYQEYAALAADPQTLNVPGGFAGGTFESFFLHQFLGRALDAYVLDDADLEEVLTEAQRQADEFMACTSSLPPVSQGSTEEELQANSQGVEDCLAKVAPDIAAKRQEMMSGITEGGSGN